MNKLKPINYVNKPWGFEIWIHNSYKYCGKVLTIFAEKSTSLHYHKLKDETFYIRRGKVKVITIDKDDYKEYIMMKGDVLNIPNETKHQLFGIAEETEIFEVSTQHFDNDTIICDTDRKII